MQALELFPQAGQRLPPGGEGQVLPYPLGHHTVALVLALENGAERAVSNVLLVVAPGRCRGGEEERDGCKTNGQRLACLARARVSVVLLSRGGGRPAGGGD